MIQIYLIIIEIIGGAITYGVFNYYYGKPYEKTKEKKPLVEFWSWDTPAPLIICAFWFITLPFVLAGNYGFKKRMMTIDKARRLVESSEKDGVFKNEVEPYIPGEWKK